MPLTRPVTSPPSTAASADVPDTSGSPSATHGRRDGPAWEPTRPGIPHWVWIVAVLAGLLHMAPYWRAALETPAGWTFTANLHSSPDYMQYRVWMRQTQEEGVFVSNRFTPEPNGRHLPVPLYWLTGKLSEVSGQTPEWVFAWLGALFAAAFVPVLYETVRRFVSEARARTWIFGTLLVGGGLGGWIQLLQEWEPARSNAVLQPLLFAPLAGPSRAVLFESYRGNYIVQALFDSHFMLFWLITTAAVLALHDVITRFSAGRLARVGALFAAGTFLHVYEGITLLSITAGVLALCWHRGLPLRRAIVIGSVCAAAVGACVAALVVIFHLSGAATPSWRGLNVLPSVLLLAYPLVWLLLLAGAGSYWRRAGINEAFLIGWAVGCLTLVLSGPFFPYPDRGTMSLQIPLFIIAGSIYFSARIRVPLRHVALAALLSGSTSLFLATSLVQRTEFKPHETHKWMSADHVAMAAVLANAGSRGEVLLAPDEPLRWLAPDYRGRHYAGHFFLTTNFERKRARVASFYREWTQDERLTFLRENGIQFVYVPDGPQRLELESMPGMRVMDRRSFGTLAAFEGVHPDAAQ